MSNENQDRGGPADRRPLRRLLRQPVVHFVLLGGLAFALQAIQGDSERSPIVITPAVEQSQKSRLAETLGRPPTSDELSAAIDDWVEREALYREGLKQGLDRDDPLIRRQVIENLQELHTMKQVPPEPTAGEVDAYLRKHGDSYSLPIRYDLEVFHFDEKPDGTGDSRGEPEQLLNELRSGNGSVDGKEPERILARPPEFLQKQYGATFVRTIASAEPTKWQQLDSKRGTVVARLLRVRGGELPEAQKRKRARAELQKKMASERRERWAAGIVERYEVIREQN